MGLDENNNRLKIWPGSLVLVNREPLTLRNLLMRAMLWDPNVQYVWRNYRKGVFSQFKYKPWVIDCTSPLLSRWNFPMWYTKFSSNPTAHPFLDNTLPPRVIWVKIFIVFIIGVALLLRRHVCCVSLDCGIPRLTIIILDWLAAFHFLDEVVFSLNVDWVAIIIFCIWRQLK